MLYVPLHKLQYDTRNNPSIPLLSLPPSFPPSLLPIGIFTTLFYSQTHIELHTNTLTHVLRHLSQLSNLSVFFLSLSLFETPALFLFFLSLSLPLFFPLATFSFLILYECRHPQFCFPSDLDQFAAFFVSFLFNHFFRHWYSWPVYPRAWESSDCSPGYVQ